MAVTLGLNLSAVRLTRELASSAKSLSKTFERLSSGLRINGAADDAAGLAVSEGLGAKARIFTRASLNVSDGISALQIVDGSSEQIGGMLQRMSELAQQAANASLSDSQRSSLNSEYQELSKEIRRIAQSTQFNNINLGAGEIRRENSRVRRTSSSGSGIDALSIAISADGKFVTYHDYGAGEVRQLNTDSGQIRSIATVAFGISTILSDESGQTVVFNSSENLTGQNSAGVAQLYKWDRNSGQLSQVTNSQASTFILGLALSADGSTIAVTGNTDYQDGGTVWSGASTALNYNTYTINATTGKVRGIVEAAAAPMAYLSLSANGKYLSYLGQYNPFGTNADGNAEIFVANLNTTTPTIRQVTQSTGAETPTTVVSNAGEIYWSSNYNLAGANTGLYNQLYRYKYSSNSVEQLTSNSTSGIILSLNLASDGGSLSMVASSTVFGDNANTLNVIRYDTQSRVAESLLATPGFDTVSAYSLSSDGNTIVATGIFDTSVSDLYTYDVSRNSLSSSIETGSGERGLITTNLRALNGVLKGLGSFSLTSQTSARGALDNTLDNIARLSSYRSELGAGMARLDSASRLLSQTTDQYKAAQSRIRDIDVAQEAAEALKLQIRQQTSVALLGQARLQPQIALQLLGY